MSYSKEFELNLYRNLIHCRKIEEKMIEMYAAGKFPGHIHSGFGEEAVFTGACATMNPQDWMKQTHRSISSTYLKGVTTKEILADCMGKKTGTSKGIGGVNHITSREHGLIGLSGSLGCDISIAAGVALALKREGKGGVSYAFFGDGAQNRGPFHEAANLAAVWKLPMIFVCDNNKFAITTPIEKTLPVPNIADRAAAYGMPSRIADGNDVLTSTRRSARWSSMSAPETAPPLWSARPTACAVTSRVTKWRTAPRRSPTSGRSATAWSAWSAA